MEHALRLKSGVVNLPDGGIIESKRKERREMLIELWRKDPTVGYSGCCCVICGNDFELGSVYAVAHGDRGQELGEMCPTCLDYLDRRRNAPEEPRARENWPAREWPTLEDLQEARGRYPFPISEADEDFVAAGDGDEEADRRLGEKIVLWRMEWEALS